jgi:hypothetical protein
VFVLGLLVAVAHFSVTGACARHVPAVAPSPGAACRQTIGDLDARWVTSETRDRARLSAWCATVGPVLVDSRPRQPNAGSTDRFVVASWNTHVGGGDVHAFVTRLERGEFTGGEHVEHFALLLQEVYRSGPEVPAILSTRAPVPHRIADRPPEGPRRDVRETAGRERLAYVYAPAMRNGFGSEDRGNAILSTERLDEPVIIELPLERQRRVAIAATIAGRTNAGVDWRLRVVDAHFDTAIAPLHGGPFGSRLRQADALIDAIDALPEVPNIVIGGDLNTWFGDREPAVSRFRRAFVETTESEQATWHGALGLRATLDHLFVRLARGSASARHVPMRFGSDHDPVLMVLTF